jgi:hypothetical protein
MGEKLQIGIDLSKKKDEPAAKDLFSMLLVDGQRITITSDWTMNFALRSYYPSMRYIIEKWQEFSGLSLQHNNEDALFIPKQSILYINKLITK